MDLRTYLEKHDGTLSKTGPELHRLAAAAGVSPSHTYLCALGLKTPSRKLAIRFAEASKERQLDPVRLLGLDVASNAAADAETVEGDSRVEPFVDAP